MVRGWLVWGLLGVGVAGATGQERGGVPVKFDRDTVEAHEVKPHRRTVPMAGVTAGLNQLHLTLTVSPVGDVVRAEASGDDAEMRYWPKLRGEVEQWRFRPFEWGGKAVTAEVEEYVNLVPPERLPEVHVEPPVLRADSKVQISLRRTGCLGTCPSYEVSLDSGKAVFTGFRFVAVEGQHTVPLGREVLLKLARQFLADFFYSMADEYRAWVTDSPTYELAIDVDGRKKRVTDYVGQEVGMPAAVQDLEEEVDRVAGTARWIVGDDGLVAALQSEEYPFQTFWAQELLKRVARNRQAGTVQDLLTAGVPLKPLPNPLPVIKLEGRPEEDTFAGVGWLGAADGQAEVLKVLMAAGASRDDQADKNVALAQVTRVGDLQSMRALLAYGADGAADFRALIVPQGSFHEKGEPNLLLYAASWANPGWARRRCGSIRGWT